MTTNVMQAMRSQPAAWEHEAQAPPESLSELLMAVGRQLGIFDALAALGGITAPALARCTGLDERFLNEWLDAMVDMGQVEFDAATARFAFPRQRAGSRDDHAPEARS
jgi:hypothetical protein